jgi:hypothetical protein
MQTLKITILVIVGTILLTLSGQPHSVLVLDILDPTLVAGNYGWHHPVFTEK